MSSSLQQWVDECEALTRPDRVHWCDGSDAEAARLTAEMLEDGTLHRLHPSFPGCFLHRSAPSDVARTENLTFICSRDPDDAGPTNNWMDPDEARARVGELFRGCMRGRTLYVVPYLMGPPDSPLGRVGVEITDSPYVVLSMRIMTRMGQVALDRLESNGAFVPGLHSVGELDPDRRFILHFPEDRLIWSYGSGYGGNALLGKKCFALRIASVLGRDEGWLAEHMLLMELEAPGGDRIYIAGAFPSACGKTSLAMLVSPLEAQGLRVRTLGDDIVWMRVGEDGRLWALNPEAGFFGVAPGTSRKTNPNALITARANSLYTNVAVSPDGIPWWEGIGFDPPPGLLDWQGRPWDGRGPAAHPNARFTAPARQCPSLSPAYDDPRGVPISAILFGGRRHQTVPLVYQSFDWEHGVFVGATMASRTTAAATAETNVLRRDPMAMLPFCGYHMGDYFRHWLDIGRRLTHPPLIFHVNWFRQDSAGRWLWPGYGENVRVLIWILERIRGRARAAETPIGWVPTPDSLHLEGLDMARPVLEELLRVDPAEWRAETPGVEEFFRKIGDRLPAALWSQLRALESRLASG